MLIFLFHLMLDLLVKALTTTNILPHVFTTNILAHAFTTTEKLL
jgi:hypothetical protein